jgi:type IV pilus assembly PilX-like protein
MKPLATTASPFPPVALRRGSESGSAYLMALLLLVVLTLLGLALVTMTQTEMEIGSNDRTIQRVFYEAESGIAIGTARFLVAGDYRPITLTLDEAGASLGFKSKLDLAPVVPLADAPCNLCEINNAGTYNEKAYRRIENIVTATATRTTALDPNTPLAQKTLSAMIEVQPWKSAPEAYAAIGDPAQLAKIKF